MCTNHRERHSVDLVFVLRFVLSKRTVPFQKLEQHASERKPIRTGVVHCTLGQHFRRHVTVGAAAILNDCQAN